MESSVCIIIFALENAFSILLEELKWKLFANFEKISNFFILLFQGVGVEQNLIAGHCLILIKMMK